MDLSFDATTIAWRGPAPFVFARVPEDESDQIAEVASLVTYGWGTIPVVARIEGVEFTTSLFPRDGVYLVPVKVAVQRATGVGVGDDVHVELHLELRG
ncbi:DUF1905 domain-containing protein [Brachybacterium endophyticum]|uniref:DUF1905 domain-containing protein n=1 Tax=Brachybacterium endophyticum TaxID=2182385 RepID=A0A2U2RJG2_9MICO|nr:DUF1905 domain-containing protein [Brachybacterium endophyticum]PWH06000.1 DUF1905 domain-containing protein [Brachybacterium endophyticum]